jgi:chaperonin GroES
VSKKVLEPAGDYIIVLDGASETTIDGIELPGNTREKEMLSGLVVFVGPDAQSCTKPQDQVLYGPYAGKTVIMNGVQFRLLRQGQIEAYVRDTE